MTTSSTIEIHNPGMLTSIQDLGRVGFRQLAIPQSGFLDADSALLANFLAGNNLNTPTLENIGGLSFTTTHECSFGLFGAGISVKKNGNPVSFDETLLAQKGDRFFVTGGVSYLAVPDGFLNSTRHFNSHSTYPLAKLGGIQGPIFTQGINSGIPPETTF